MIEFYIDENNYVVLIKKAYTKYYYVFLNCEFRENQWTYSNEEYNYFKKETLKNNKIKKILSYI